MIDSAPALHIWIDANKRMIVRTLHDGGQGSELKRVEKYNRTQGLTNLWQVVVTEGTVRVVPPGEVES